MQGLQSPALLLLAVLATCTCTLAVLPPAEDAVLRTAFASFNGNYWLRRDNWLQGDACVNQWFGVRCSPGNDTVTALSLSSNNLTGSMPEQLGQLTSVQLFKLDGNAIDGPLPSFFATHQTFGTIFPWYNGLKSDYDFSLNRWTQPTPLWCSQAPLGNRICASTLPRQITCPPVAAPLISQDLPPALQQSSGEPSFDARTLSSASATQPQTGLLAFADATAGSGVTPEVAAFRLLASPGAQVGAFVASFAQRSQFAPSEQLPAPLDFHLGAPVGAFDVAAALVLDHVLQFADNDGDGVYSPNNDDTVSGPWVTDLDVVWVNNGCFNRTQQTRRADAAVVNSASFSARSQPPFGQSFGVALQADFADRVAQTATGDLLTPLSARLRFDVTGFPTQASYGSSSSYDAPTYMAASFSLVGAQRLGSTSSATVKAITGSPDQARSGDFYLIASGDALYELSAQLSSTAIVDGLTVSAPTSLHSASSGDVAGLARRIVFINATSPLTVQRVYVTLQRLLTSSQLTVDFSINAQLAVGRPPRKTADGAGGALTSGQIAGIAIGGAVLGASLVFICVRRRRAAKQGATGLPATQTSENWSRL